MLISRCPLCRPSQFWFLQQNHQLSLTAYRTSILISAVESPMISDPHAIIYGGAGFDLFYRVNVHACQFLVLLAIAEDYLTFSSVNKSVLYNLLCYFKSDSNPLFWYLTIFYYQHVFIPTDVLPSSHQLNELFLFFCFVLVMLTLYMIEAELVDSRQWPKVLLNRNSLEQF